MGRARGAAPRRVWAKWGMFHKALRMCGAASPPHRIINGLQRQTPTSTWRKQKWAQEGVRGCQEKLLKERLARVYPGSAGGTQSSVKGFRAVGGMSAMARRF